MVFLFFSLLLIAIFINSIIFSKIKIEIKDFKFSTQTKTHINKDYKIIFKLYAFKLIPIFKISIRKQKIKKLDYSKYLDSVKIEKNFIPAIKELKFKAKQLRLYIRFGNRRCGFYGNDNSNY